MCTLCLQSWLFIYKLIHYKNHRRDDLICIQTMDKSGKTILVKYKVTAEEIDIENVVFTSNFTIE